MRVIRATMYLVMTMVGFGLLSGCLVGGEDAEDAAKARLQATSQGEYAEVWESLHPNQQAVVTKEKFVECGEAGAAARSPEIEDLEVLSESVVEKEIPEVGIVESHVVALQWLQGEDTRGDDFDMVEVDGEWTWVLSAEVLESFRAGECPV